MPSLAAIVSTGRATLKDHYAVALASCCKREDILRCHREATTPQRRPGEPLNLATSRHEQAVRAVASVGCPLAPGTQFWALYGLLTCEENILFTSQPGVPDRLVGTINEPPAAAAARFSALLSDLLSWSLEVNQLFLFGIKVVLISVAAVLPAGLPSPTYCTSRDIPKKQDP